jgi:hypothetical protein
LRTDATVAHGWPTSEFSNAIVGMASSATASIGHSKRCATRAERASSDGSSALYAADARVTGASLGNRA